MIINGQIESGTLAQGIYVRQQCGKSVGVRRTRFSVPPRKYSDNMKKAHAIAKADTSARPYYVKLAHALRYLAAE